MAMNLEVKAKWVEGLKSGKFPQAGGALKTEEGFCCLGVLCEVTGLGTWGEKEEYLYGGGIIRASHYVMGKSSKTEVLPDPLFEAVGLDAKNPDVNIPDELMPQLKAICGDALQTSVRTLSWLNDKGVPFPLMAQLIERDATL